MPRLRPALDQSRLHQFYDGAPLPGGPGGYLVEYLIYGKASRFNDERGDQRPLPKQQIETFAPLTQA